MKGIGLALEQMEKEAAAAIQAGTLMTLMLPRRRRNMPRKFPQGELLLQKQRRLECVHFRSGQGHGMAVCQRLDGWPAPIDASGKQQLASNPLAGIGWRNQKSRPVPLDSPSTASRLKYIKINSKRSDCSFSPRPYHRGGRSGHRRGAAPPVQAVRSGRLRLQSAASGGHPWHIVYQFMMAFRIRGKRGARVGRGCCTISAVDSCLD